MVHHLLWYFYQRRHSSACLFLYDLAMMMMDSCIFTSMIYIFIWTVWGTERQWTLAGFVSLPAPNASHCLGGRGLYVKDWCCTAPDRDIRQTDRLASYLLLEQNSCNSWSLWREHPTTRTLMAHLCVNSETNALQSSLGSFSCSVLFYVIFCLFNWLNVSVVVLLTEKRHLCCSSVEKNVHVFFVT